VRTVPIAQILGSEGRSDEFASFRPLQTHTEDHWEGVAIAWRMGVTLPLVVLIRVGDVHFVHDGHRRISVAKAIGQDSIDAEVTVLEVVGPLPCDGPTPLRAAAPQPA
jgi:hypothetical protein